MSPESANGQTHLLAGEQRRPDGRQHFLLCRCLHTRCLAAAILSCPLQPAEQSPDPLSSCSHPCTRQFYPFSLLLLSISCSPLSGWGLGTMPGTLCPILRYDSMIKESDEKVFNKAIGQTATSRRRACCLRSTSPFYTFPYFPHLCPSPKHHIIRSFTQSHEPSCVRHHNLHLSFCFPAALSFHVPSQ